MLNSAAKEWVKALRSGEFKQRKGSLGGKEFGGYCCLGVACELAVKAGVIPSYCYLDWTLPLAVKDWLGLVTDRGTYTLPDGELFDLVYANDGKSRGQSKTFSEIADIIESEPKDLFVEQPTEEVQT